MVFQGLTCGYFLLFFLCKCHQVQDYCDNRCRVFSPHILSCDVHEEVKKKKSTLRAVTQEEVASLYRRFRDLDKRRKGYVTSEELLGVPELAINPLGRRVVQLFTNVNFKDFCRLLSVFTEAASEREQIGLLFKIHDIDGDGLISRSDLEAMLRNLGGSSLSESHVADLADIVLTDGQLDFDSFVPLFAGDVNLQVQIPPLEY